MLGSRLEGSRLEGSKLECSRLEGSRLEGDAMLTLAIYIFNVLLSFLASTFNR